MADKKISALTSATTPLAGTEVLPIVQSGTTVKVAVSDLTAGRDVAALSLALNSAPARDTSNISYKQMFYNTAGDGVANTVIGQLRSQVRNYGTNIATASFATIQFATDPSAWYKGEIRFLTNGFDGTDGVGTLAAKIDSAQNYVPQIAGKGINFTANTPAAGMTSQLLNWYEEGTYTPTVTSSSGSITTYSATGNYTRVGRQVTANIQVTLTNAGTASGALSATIPFTCGQFPAMGSGREDQNTGLMLQGRIASGAPTVVTILTYANLTPIATGNVVQMTITYFV